MSQSIQRNTINCQTRHSCMTIEIFYMSASGLLEKYEGMKLVSFWVKLRIVLESSAVTGLSRYINLPDSFSEIGESRRYTCSCLRSDHEIQRAIYAKLQF